jgi:hypothetical protein
VALLDYQKLCPRSGHFLTSDERDALRAKARAPGEGLVIVCECCGRTVEVCQDSGRGRKLMYPMHVKEVNGSHRDDGAGSK